MEIVKELKKRASRLSVLYVEDDIKIREEVGEFLKNFFHTVEIANDGQEGLEKFRDGDFSLVVTDIKMPRLNGLEMAKQIKKLKNETKIIVTSAYDEKKLLMNAIENSIDHYIVKPIEFSDFIVYLFKTVSLINLEKKVGTFHRHMQAVLNYQDNMIMTIKEGKVTSMNKKFLAFFQLDSLKEMYEKKINLADYVVREVGFYSPKDATEWVREIQKLGDASLMVKLIDKRNQRHEVFSLKVGKLEEFGETIVSLTNISDFINGAVERQKGRGEFLFFDHEHIPHFFTFLKNEINRTKRYRLPLSLIQLVLNPGEMDARQLARVDEMVEARLKLTDCYAKPLDTKYIIVKVDTEPETAYALAQSLHTMLEKEFVQVPGFRAVAAVVSLEAKDTLQEILSRAERLIFEAKENPKNDIRCDKCRAKSPETVAEEKKRVLDKLRSHAKKKSTVKVVNFYNGMKVVEEGSVVSVDTGEETADLKIGKRQFSTLKAGDHLFIEMADLSGEVGGVVDELLYHEQRVRVRALAFDAHSPLKREYVRVTTEPGLSVTLQEGRHTIRGTVLDLSLKSLACEVPHIEGLALGKVIDIALVLPLEKEETVEISAEIYKIERYGENYRIVLLLLAEPQYKQVVTAYITKREKRIVNEIRAL